jgi:preprotein translocase subunit SecB
MSEPKTTAQLSQIVLLESEFRHRGDPMTQPADTKVKPQRLGVEISATGFDPNGIIVVRLTVGSDPEEEGALYDFRVSLAAMFKRNQQTPAEWSERQFAEIGATMMMPFAREAIANLTSRGRFGTVWLNPFNVLDLLSNQSDAEEKSPRA